MDELIYVKGIFKRMVYLQGSFMGRFHLREGFIYGNILSVRR